MYRIFIKTYKCCCHAKLHFIYLLVVATVGDIVHLNGYVQILVITNITGC